MKITKVKPVTEGSYSRLTLRERRNDKQQKQHVRYQTQRLGVQRQPCEICGVEPAECHHIDYADPERVMWLCTKHHRQTHSQFGKPAPLDWMADIRAAVAKIEATRLELRRSRAAQSSSAS